MREAGSGQKVSKVCCASCLAEEPNGRVTAWWEAVVQSFSGFTKLLWERLLDLGESKEISLSFQMGHGKDH